MCRPSCPPRSPSSIRTARTARTRSSSWPAPASHSRLRRRWSSGGSTRYVVHREAELHEGLWLPFPEPLPEHGQDAFPENEARSLAGVLGKALASVKRGAPQEATTDDGRLILRAAEATGLLVAEVAEVLGVDRSLLSRALGGRAGLAARHRERLEAWIAWADSAERRR